ncbi:uncharacterized protein VP01_740g3 [Puccinia sorghi]|uniref:PB1 domain-containing protein n=1 Tax=Puccinia sorghi TaxID=27349 RepID=A0A0L6UCH9_9BASI|nr:uncharacterized protein VP01_740g3 [Puccinia sorghi]
MVIESPYVNWSNYFNPGKKEQSYYFTSPNSAPHMIRKLGLLVYLPESIQDEWDEVFYLSTTTFNNTTTTMSLKAEIETWANALELYDSQNFDEALAAFEDIADSSKILFNIGLIYATLGEHEVAIENFRTATSLDQYLAVAYFQCGVSNFLLGMYEEAVKDFEDALLYLRGNLTIDYSQLGLKFRLYSCEVLFNKGLSLIYQVCRFFVLVASQRPPELCHQSVLLLFQGAEEDGMIDLQEARKEKQTPEHSVIDDAIADRAEGYTVFSIPVGVLYRPAMSKVKNLASKNYLGQAKLVAATDASETFVGFTGSARAAAKTSTAPMGDGPSGIVRRGTTAARIEGTVSRSSAVNDLRRRPSDNTATISPRIVRSATTSSGSRQASTKLPPMNEGRERNGIDDYIDNGPPDDRMTNWARNVSTSGSSSGRRPPPGRRFPPTNSSYDDRDGSDGEYAETAVSGYAEMTKIRVKLHHGSDTRGMAIATEMQFAEFLGKVTKKLSLPAGMVAMKYKDEEGSMVSILDDDDWESAVETARAYAKGRAEGKVEIWVENTGFS